MHYMTWSILYGHIKELILLMIYMQKIIWTELYCPYTRISSKETISNVRFII